jgi:putative ABC transport system substrate-binding protein
MRRREFIALLGGVTAARPLAALAQRPAMPTIGYLHGGSPESNEHRIAAFRRGLNETGYVEGENVAIEFRWAHNQSDRLPELAADLVRRQMVVIVTPGSTPSAHAAKAATSTIPIVFGRQSPNDCLRLFRAECHGCCSVTRGRARTDAH